MIGAGRLLRLGRTLGGGLLWGLIVNAAELGFMPAADNLYTRLLLLGAITAIWCLSGLILALADLLAERASMAIKVVLLALLSAPMGAVQALVVQWVDARRSGAAPPSLLAVALHTSWLTFFYGALALTALTLVRRNARIQAVLSQAVVAQRQSEARLRETAARELRGQVQPARLLALMGQLEQRYAEDRAVGDRLLERMTEFLRAAMPSVRSGGSTLAGELETLRAYGLLLGDLDPGLGAWILRLQAPPPEMAFPPLVLLPTLDALSDASGAAVEVRLVDDGLRLRLQLAPTRPAAAGWLDAGLEQRLRLSLRGVFSETAELILRAPAAAGEAAIDVALPLKDPRTAPARSFTQPLIRSQTYGR